MLDLLYAKKPLVKTANRRKMTTFRKVVKMASFEKFDFNPTDTDLQCLYFSRHW